MNYCSWKYRVEAYHDGEDAASAALQDHLLGCPRCREHLAALERMRHGVLAVRQEVEIGDAQFRVFMDGVRAGIEAPAPSRWWAVLNRVSLVAAGVVLIVALSYIVTSGPVRTWAGQMFNGGPSEDAVQLRPEFNGGVNPQIKGDLP